MAQKLRVAVLGYYGHLNSGDDLLQSALSYIFQDHCLLFSSWFPGIDFLQQVDLIVVGGGSIWPGNKIFQLAEKVAKELRTPLMVLGISAAAKGNQLKAVRDTQKLIESSVFFHVRDADTARVLGKHHQIQVGADLFWWMPWEAKQLNAEKNHQDKQIALSLRDWKNLDWNPQEIISTIQEKGYKINAFPFYFGSPVHDANSDVNDTTYLQQFDLGHVPSSWTTAPVETSKIVVAMRYHAVLVAVRMGCPVISFDYHDKIKNFYQENGLEELCIPINQPQELAKAIELIEQDYANYLIKFSQVRQQLLTQGSRDLKLCRQILETIEPKSHIIAELRQLLGKLWGVKQLRLKSQNLLATAVRPGIVVSRKVGQFCRLLDS